MKNDFATLPVAVIGAGPIGLAAAAHLLERGFTPVVLEATAGPIPVAIPAARKKSCCAGPAIAPQDACCAPAVR
jgi:2-polyprenyl-6-methoxyphenol hydroxylase-like FAD-dependent oxidoreductase